MTYCRARWFIGNRVTAPLAAASLIVALGCGRGGVSDPPRSAGQASSALGDARQLVERARQAVRRGDSIRAEHYFALAVLEGYDEGEVLPELLSVCLNSSRLRSALNYASPYLRKHPELVSLRYLVATVHLGLGQKDAARQELLALLRHDPRHADAHFLLGMLEFELERDSAEAHLNQYLVLHPDGDKANEVRERLAQGRFDAESSSRDFASDRRQQDEPALNTWVPLRTTETNR